MPLIEVVVEFVIVMSFLYSVSCLFSLLVHAHQSGAGGEAYSEAYDHRWSSPFLLVGQHESRRGARKISVVLKYVIGLFNFG